MQWCPSPNGFDPPQPHTLDPVQELYQLFNLYLRGLEWRRPASDGLTPLQPHTAHFIQELHQSFNRYPLALTPDQPLLYYPPCVPPAYYATTTYDPADILSEQCNWHTLSVVSMAIMCLTYPSV